MTTRQRKEARKNTRTWDDPLYPGPCADLNNQTLLVSAHDSEAGVQSSGHVPCRGKKGHQATPKVSLNSPTGWRGECLGAWPQGAEPVRLAAVTAGQGRAIIDNFLHRPRPSLLWPPWPCQGPASNSYPLPGPPEAPTTAHRARLVVSIFLRGPPRTKERPVGSPRTPEPWTWSGWP